MPSVDPGRAVLFARIRIGLRRATGQTHDVDTLLDDPDQAAIHVARWRGLGFVELDRLLDQFEGAGAAASFARQPTGPADAPVSRPASLGAPARANNSVADGHGASNGHAPVPPASTAHGVATARMHAPAAPIDAHNDPITEPGTLPGDLADAAVPPADYSRYLRGAR